VTESEFISKAGGRNLLMKQKNGNERKYFEVQLKKSRAKVEMLQKELMLYCNSILSGIDGLY
jgi:hypothetical protein